MLRRCLDALARQSLAPEYFEVIVADDGPDAATHDEVFDFQKQSAFAVHYVPVVQTQGPAGARNAGWKRARADIIAFTDDDTIPDGAWLEEGWKAFADPSVAALWGYIDVPLPAEPTDYEWDAAGLSRAEFATANCFCRRNILERTGGFDERFTAAWREDSDLYFSILECSKASHPPQKVQHVPSAVVVHPVRPASWGVSLRQQKKSLFNALLYKKHPRLYGEKIQAHPPWLYYGILLALLVLGGSLVFSIKPLAWLAFFVWLALTLRFLQKRLAHTSRQLKHICEMIVTSLVIPLLSIYWRLRGALHFRVLFL